MICLSLFPTTTVKSQQNGMYTRACAQRLVGRDDRSDKANEIIMETIFQNYIAATVVVTLGADETEEERTFHRAETARLDTS